MKNVVMWFVNIGILMCVVAIVSIQVGHSKGYTVGYEDAAVVCEDIIIVMEKTQDTNIRIEKMKCLSTLTEIKTMLSE